MNHLLFACSLTICSSASLFLLYRFCGFANLGHGEFLLLGAFVGSFALSHGCGFATATFISAIAGALLSVGLLLICNSLLSARDQIGTLLVSVAAGIAISEMLRLLVGGSGTTMPVNAVWRMSVFGLPKYDWLVIASAVAIGGGAAAFSRSSFGLRARAATCDAQFVECFGSNVTRLRAGTFLVAGLCAGGVGCLLGPMMAIIPYGGEEYTLKGFVVACFARNASVSAWIGACVGLGAAEFLLARYWGGPMARFALWAIVIIAAFIQQWLRPINDR